MVGMQSISGAAIARILFIITAAVLFATTSCGLVHKDVPVVTTFQVGGVPTSLTSLTSADITAPLKAGAGDVSALSSVNMNIATLDSNDGMDLSFVADSTITVSGPAPLTTIELAKLTSPGAVGTANYTIENEPDLRPYLESSSASISVTFDYSPPPIAARSLKLTLNFHATL